MGHPATIVLQALSTGAIVEVLHDEFDLTIPFESGYFFSAILDPGSLPHAGRFLHTIQKNRLAMDFKLEVARRDGLMSLIFSGCQSEHGMLIIGAREVLSRESLVRELTAIADHYSAKRQTPREESRRYIGVDWSALLVATAHELRNPLNGILAASQYLLEDAGSLLKPEHITLLRSVESSSRSLFRVIDDSIEASAIESGELRLDPAPTDILALIRKNLSSNRLSAERKNVQMDLSSAGSLPLISLDPLKISRVVDNLLTKCIQSSRPGGRIEIYVDIKEQEAIITMQSKKSFLSADQCHFLSNPHQESKYVLSKVKPSEIIGFRMVNIIIERHRGAIRVESDAGKGLTFILALPISAVSVLSHGHSLRPTSNDQIPKSNRESSEFNTSQK